MSFGLYGIAFIGGWVEQIGTLAAADAARYMGTALSLVSPATRCGGARSTSSSRRSSAIFTRPFVSPAVPSEAMVLWAAGFGVLLLVFALSQFRRRPL